MKKFNFQEILSHWQIRLLPIFICFLYFFDLPYTLIHERFAKHGLMNRFFLLAGFVISFILLFDWFVRNEEKITERTKFYLYSSVIFLLSFLLRLTFFDFESSDYQGALSKWYDLIKNNGGFAALKAGNFSDYNATYLYIMAGLTYFPIHKLYGIKLVSIIFDYLAAIFIYKMVSRKYGKYSLISLFSLVATLFSPTVLLNGSFWAQCDVIYSSFLVISIYYFSKNEVCISRKNAILALVFFSIGFTFKLQAVFLVILIFYVYARGELRLTDFTILPLVWLLSILPNYLLGRDLMNLLLIYGHQVLNYPYLSLNATNIYQLLPNAPYEIFVKAGIFWTFCVCIFFSIFLIKKRKYILPTTQNILDLALLSLLILPYLLPKMHERYFFAADLVSIIWAFYRPKYWYLSLIIIGLSTISYIPFLFNQDVIPLSIAGFVMGLVILKIMMNFVRAVFKQANP